MSECRNSLWRYEFSQQCPPTTNLWWRFVGHILTLVWRTSVCWTVKYLTTVITSGVNHGYYGNIDTSTRCKCTEEANKAEHSNRISQWHSAHTCNKQNTYFEVVLLFHRNREMNIAMMSYEI